MEEVRMSYPEPKLWSKRARSIQYVPEGSQGIVETLRIIFNAVQNENDPETVLEIPGSEYRTILDDVCTRIKPAGFTKKVDGTWRLTDESISWLENESNDYLAAILCANVMFMGEQLAQMKSPKTARELLFCATECYGMTWKGVQQVSMRNHWLRALGYVLYHDVNQTYELTDAGRAFLTTVKVLSPEEVMEEKDITTPQREVPSEWALRMCDLSQERLTSRGVPLSRVPKGLEGSISTITSALTFLESPRSIEELDGHLYEAQGVSKSSSTVLRGTLNTQLGLTQRTAKGIALTETAKKWLENQKPIDLACIVHASRRFVFEILREVDAGANTRRALGSISKTKYEIKLYRDSLSSRIKYLELAGLLIESFGFLELTEAGRSMLGNVQLEADEVQPEARGALVQTAEGAQQYLLTDLLFEIRDASLDSANAKRFECACARAFQFLGFKAECHGGTGETDILVETNGISQYAYKIAVDAKSSSKGYVADNDIKFDSLDYHRDAIRKSCGLDTYSVVVAPSFGEGRIRENAVKHKVLLLDADALCELIRMHDDIPLTSADYRILFESFGIARLEAFTPHRSTVRQRGLLLKDIMSTMLDVADGDDGLFGEKELGRSIRRYRGGIGQGVSAPDAEEAKQPLAFLSSPIVGILEVVNEKPKEYRAKCSAGEASRLLSYFAHVFGESPL